ncbi:MAG: ribonuclease Z [Thermoprotei archaeon]|nr:ribonuclease Z [TACK group archaeon]
MRNGGSYSVTENDSLIIMIHLERAGIDYAYSVARHNGMSLEQVEATLEDLVRKGLVERAGSSSIKRSDARFKRSDEVHKHHTYFSLTRAGKLALREVKLSARKHAARLSGTKLGSLMRKGAETLMKEASSDELKWLEEHGMIQEVSGRLIVTAYGRLVLEQVALLGERTLFLVKFLGTASGAPVSGFFPSSMIVIKNGEKVLVDVGEGIQHQLFRSGIGLRGLHTIVITHMHGDHVMGLPGLLMSLSLLNADMSISIHGPREVKGFVEFVLDATRSGQDALGWTSFREIGQPFSVGEMSIRPFRVKHRIPSFGLVFQENQRPGRFLVEEALKLGVPRGPLWGKLQRGQAISLEGHVITPQQVLGPARKGAKLTFTGDAAPSEELVANARESDCLIHDAAFPPGDEEEAHRFGHSTWKDAINSAKEACVKKLVLYNFGGKTVSQLDELLAFAESQFPGVVLAKDMMELEVSVDDGFDRACKGLC